MLLLIILILCIIAFPALRDLLLGIVGIIIIIAAICILGPIVIGFLPIILGILIPLCVISYIYAKQKHHSRIKWLNARGIEQIPNTMGNLDAWKDAADMGFAILAEEGYVISPKFRNQVMKKAEHHGVFMCATFQQFCAQSANAFQSVYMRPFLSFLMKEEQVFPIALSNGETIYISPSFVAQCRELFEKEGAATMAEFSQCCEELVAPHGFRQYSWGLAEFIISKMLSAEEIQSVDLPDQGECLYVAKKQRADSKMTKVEITLDD